MNLKNLGVQEMNAKELVGVDGGQDIPCCPLHVFAEVGKAVLGFFAGLTAGMED